MKYAVYTLCVCFAFTLLIANYAHAEPNRKNKGYEETDSEPVDIPDINQKKYKLSDSQADPEESEQNQNNKNNSDARDKERNVPVYPGNSKDMDFSK